MDKAQKLNSRSTLVNDRQRVQETYPKAHRGQASDISPLLLQVRKSQSPTKATMLARQAMDAFENECRSPCGSPDRTPFRNARQALRPIPAAAAQAPKPAAAARAATSPKPESTLRGLPANSSSPGPRPRLEARPAATSEAAHPAKPASSSPGRHGIAPQPATASMVAASVEVGVSAVAAAGPGARSPEAGTTPAASSVAGSPNRTGAASMCSFPVENLDAGSDISQRDLAPEGSPVRTPLRPHPAVGRMLSPVVETSWAESPASSPAGTKRVGPGRGGASPAQAPTRPWGAAKSPSSTPLIKLGASRCASGCS